LGGGQGRPEDLHYECGGRNGQQDFMRCHW
jgi:hypothetical protein